MQVRIPKSRIDYIRSIKLESSIGSSQSGSGSVVAGSIVVFLPSVSASQKRDVIDSLVLAQLAANKSFDREMETSQWYGSYKSILQNIGWQIGDFNFSYFKSSQEKIVLSDFIRRILNQDISGIEAQLLENAFNALEETPASERVFTIFDSGSFAENSGNFQICIASSDANGQVILKVGGFFFEFSGKIDSKFLFANINADEINLYTNVAQISLNEQIYNTVRKAIIDKLGDRVEELTAGINLP